MANQQHVEYGAHCSVDYSIVALPIMKDRTIIYYKDPRNCTIQSTFGCMIELIPQQLSSFV